MKPTNKQLNAKAAEVFGWTPVNGVDWLCVDQDGDFQGETSA